MFTGRVLLDTTIILHSSSSLGSAINQRALYYRTITSTIVQLTDYTLTDGISTQYMYFY